MGFPSLKCLKFKAGMHTHHLWNCVATHQIQKPAELVHGTKRIPSGEPSRGWLCRLKSRTHRTQLTVKWFVSGVSSRELPPKVLRVSRLRAFQCKLWAHKSTANAIGKARDSPLPLTTLLLPQIRHLASLGSRGRVLGPTRALRHAPELPLPVPMPSNKTSPTHA